MTTSQLPTEIRAEIHQDAITRVSAFFNASSSAVLGELLQNCRRAGATRVDITTHENGSLTVTDDGKGVDHPATLLAFGQTGWTREKAVREHPAGMGLYSLARCREVTIRSKQAGGPAWRVDLRPAHFTGEEPAQVTELDPDTVPEGTSVTFSQDGSRSEWLRKHPREHVENAACHYPLPVTLDGEPVPQKDFLASARRTEEWQGVRIGVYTGKQNMKLNFHGIVISDPNLPTVYSLDGPWQSHVDVIDAPDLELTLPARHEIVENSFAEELRQACRRAIYRTMAEADPPVDVAKETQDLAKAAGIDIPDASPMLREYVPEVACWTMREVIRRTPLHEKTVVMDADIETTADEQALGRALEMSGHLDHLKKADSRLIGYGWYDALPRITDFRVTLTTDGEDADLEEAREAGDLCILERPDAIRVTITTSGPEGPGEFTIPADVWFGDPEETNWTDVHTMVTKSSRIDPWTLAQLMEAAYFDPSDDAGSDSHDTQREYAEKTFERLAIALLHDEEEAMKAALTTAAKNYLYHELITDKAAVITIQRGSPPDVKIIDRAETAEPSG